MALPSREQLETWAEGYVTLWNAGDKEAWLANWRRVAPGDFRMLDPVGTPEKRGIAACAAGPFDLFQPSVKFHVPPETRFFCGSEVGWVMENHATHEGRSLIHKSIETYRFEADGSVWIRTYYVVPSHSDPAMGGIFQQYLPDSD